MKLTIDKNTSWNDYGITEGDVYREMGYNEAALPDDGFRKLTQGLISEVAWNKPAPSFYFHFIDGEINGDTLCLGDEEMHVGDIIAHQLKMSETYVIFAASAGKGFVAWQKEIAEEGDIAKIYIVDVLGSIIAEKTADMMEVTLESVLDADMHHTNRFSPGYCGWHVREQKNLFGLFPDHHPCAILLTDSCLMLPIKSVSGVIGIGHKVRKLDYTCGLCTASFCYKRQKPLKNV